jgi:hypothetical protein
VLDEAASSALSGAASDDGTSLVVFDVDGFASVNDRFGHPGGDQVLVQPAGPGGDPRAPRVSRRRESPKRHIGCTLRPTVA